MSFIAVSHKFTIILKKHEKNIKMTFCDIHINISPEIFQYLDHYTLVTEINDS